MATRLALFLWIYLAAEAFAIVALFLAWAVPPRSRLVERTYSAAGALGCALFAPRGGCSRSASTSRRRCGRAGADRRPDAAREHRRQPPPRLFVPPRRTGCGCATCSSASCSPTRRSTSRAGGCRTASSAAAPTTRRPRSHACARLAAGLGPDEGVLIYPEGTRFTAAKRERAIERQPRAAELRNVPPPRPGGTLAVMETGADVVVICAHHGLDGFASIGDPGAAGSRRTVRIRFSRFPGASPEGREARTTGSGSAGTRSTTDRRAGGVSAARSCSSTRP